MTQYNFSLLNYRFRLELKKTRRKTVFTPLVSALGALRSIRSGSKISRLARFVFERVNLKALLGGNLAALVMLTGVLSPAGAALAQTEPEATTLEVTLQPISTEITIQYPVNPVIFNQGYHFFHWGIDLDGVTGDPVYPIKKGRVERVEHSRWGYGNAVLIDHGGNLKSFYAHLSSIEAREGQEVRPTHRLGEMGSTGRSTGDHLHLEIYQNGRPVNPRTILGK